jgi:hypothetical protein
MDEGNIAILMEQSTLGTGKTIVFMVMDFVGIPMETSKDSKKNLALFWFADNNSFL